MAKRIGVIWQSVWQEIKFALKIKSVRWVLLASVLLSVTSASSGLFEVNQQRAQLKQLKKSIAEEQAHVLPSQTSAGGTAYYVFHLTYDSPSPLAFASLGVRDELSWKHRIRMLALEGQIYESDPGNPELSSLGKLDFTYVATILLPLFIIGLLFDLKSSEKRESRYELLCTTASQGGAILFYRAIARTALLLSAITLPFIAIALFAGATLYSIALIVVIVSILTAFWLIVCHWIIHLISDGTTTLVSLFSIWLLLTILIPVAGKTLVEYQVATPTGGEILLVQREKVNDAWDLPKNETMAPFLETHPQWKNTAPVQKPFEWKWYYAFQQMGDQHVSSRSNALEQAIAKRDQLMGWVAWLSPSLAVERGLNRIARTDVKQHQHYIRCVRDFHKTLRDFHYPMLFGETTFTEQTRNEIPKYTPCN